MTSYKFGDVVLVPFPFTDQSASKKRPAVVVSSAAYHADHINLVLIGVSSQISGSLRAGEGIERAQHLSQAFSTAISFLST
jgi:mRNA interferase MazF